MNTEGYLMISNVITGVLLVTTCSFACRRRRVTECPYCGAHVQQDGLRQHIDICNVRIGAIAPRSSVVQPVPLPVEQVYAVAVPLPPPYYGNAKVADV